MLGYLLSWREMATLVKLLASLRAFYRIIWAYPVAPAEGDKVNELLLDGQQRFTVLWRSLNDLYFEHTFLVDVSDKGNPEVVKATRWEKNGKRYPAWVDDPRECWKRNLVPISLLTENGKMTAASSDRSPGCE